MQNFILSSQSSLQRDDIRYIIESDTDLEGYFNLSTEYWDAEKNKWDQGNRLECIPLDILDWFSKIAKILLKPEYVNS